MRENGPQQLLSDLSSLWRIRHFEERVRELSAAGEIAGSVHLCNGGGRLRALVNDAGQASRFMFADCARQAWRTQHEINLDSVYSFTRACLPAPLAGHGAVVSLASVADLVGTEGLAARSSTKAAIIALTRSLALEHGHRVRFNGDIQTRMMAGVLASAALRDALAERIPARRFGRPEEVASAVSWLLSDESAYVSSVALPVDGGLTAELRETRAPCEPYAPPGSSGGTSRRMSGRPA